MPYALSATQWSGRPAASIAARPASWSGKPLSLLGYGTGLRDSRLSNWRELLAQAM